MLTFCEVIMVGEPAHIVLMGRMISALFFHLEMHPNYKKCHHALFLAIFSPLHSVTNLSSIAPVITKYEQF